MVAARIALAALVAVLFAPALGWLARTFSDVYFRANAFLFVGALVLVLARVRREDLTAPVTARRGPIALFLLAQLLFFANERFLGINTFAAMLLLVELYALVGLSMSAETWRRGLAALLLLVAVLPFGDHVDTHLGFRARKLTAHVVERMLGLWDVAAIPSETVLFLESGVVYVEAPCSGLRSLWSGMIFWSALSWILRARIDLGWLLRGIAFAVALLVANIARVFMIVTLAVVLQVPRAAELVHQPIGVIGFVVASALAYLSLRYRKPAQITEKEARKGNPLPLLAAATVLSIVLVPARAKPIPAIGAPALTQLTGGDALPLTDAEKKLFASVGQTRADKQTFELDGHAGTLITVYSTSWHAHHAPEICLAANGRKVDTLETLVLGPGLELRIASLDGGARTALYWFQSASRTTADVLTRMLADEREWVLVSIVVDGRFDGENARALFDRIHGEVDRRMKDRS